MLSMKNLKLNIKQRELKAMERGISRIKIKLKLSTQYLQENSNTNQRKLKHTKQ